VVGERNLLSELIRVEAGRLETTRHHGASLLFGSGMKR